MGQEDLGRGHHRPLLAQAGGGGPGPLRFETADEISQVLLEKVVPQVHHEVVVAQEVPGYEHGMGQPEGRFLLEVGDLQAPSRTVPHRRLDLRRRVPHDDADLLDTGGGDGLQPVEKDRLVGDGHQLLGAGVGDRPQPRPRASRKDQGFH